MRTPRQQVAAPAPESRPPTCKTQVGFWAPPGSAQAAGDVWAANQNGHLRFSQIHKITRKCCVSIALLFIPHTLPVLERLTPPSWRLTADDTGVREHSSSTGGPRRRCGRPRAPVPHTARPVTAPRPPRRGEPGLGSRRHRPAPPSAEPGEEAAGRPLAARQRPAPGESPAALPRPGLRPDLDAPAAGGHVPEAPGPPPPPSPPPRAAHRAPARGSNPGPRRAPLGLAPSRPGRAAPGS
ncbi:basic proline-rich protein-like [Lepus europaeus]|uniref:basic proline-rich protein-like n=1 Tax=Lepus europaeus TaxID=9983 RepID=UPI002B478F1B|nr:basic proline-rich protein-like [Lepus europaeus]